MLPLLVKTVVIVGAGSLLLPPEVSVIPTRVELAKIELPRIEFPSVVEPSTATPVVLLAMTFPAPAIVPR